ncbi:hypothetical protein DPMN_037564 [Dreissena polymorpha]|uniref:Apple domain-containing protein n=1 Tax=Dreissena polymorpha TaxID=45954 RepID=A0A9D4RPZ0_DREPO|nr:hypothetical protein DPMN_037564 [Dreissena polymorpha]
MNLTVYLYAIYLTAVKGIQGLKTSKFLSGNIYVEKVCVGNYRVFTRVSVSSATECATVCSETIGCDAIFFSSVNVSCTGCKKLTNLSSELVASTANVFYQLGKVFAIFGMIMFYFGTTIIYKISTYIDAQSNRLLHVTD